MNQVMWLMLFWVACAVVGIVLNLSNMFLSDQERQWLVSHRLNGPRLLLASIHFSEALSHFMFMTCYGAVGLWVMVLRSGDDAALTVNGIIFFLALFFPVVWLTVTDILNIRKRLAIIQAYLVEGTALAAPPAGDAPPNSH